MRTFTKVTFESQRIIYEMMALTLEVKTQQPTIQRGVGEAEGLCDKQIIEHAQSLINIQ